MRAFICCIVLLLTASPIQGQVVDAERGKVEFVGLEQWTVTNLVDTLKALEPDRSLHACAAVLGQQLGFADASVIGYPAEGGLYTVVTVIEPEDSARVQYLPAPADKMEPVAAWQEAISILEEQRSAFHMGLQLYGHILTDQPDTARAKAAEFVDYANPEKVEALWRFLQQHNDEQVRELALWTLTRDGSEKNRIVAAALLSNFPESDLTWWRLVDTLRDSDPQVRSIAQAVLYTLSKHVPRTVDWTPAVASLRWLLNGTNLFAFTATLDLLQKTNVSPELADELVKDNTELLLAYFKAEHEKTRQAAQEFLAHLSGQNYDSYEQWEQWVKQLEQEE